MNIPKIRFKEFNTEWDSVDLKNIFNYFSTNSLSRDQLSNNGKVKNIHYGDIHRKFPTIVDVEKYVDTYIKDLNYINKYELCKNGDLIFADASEDYDGIGKAIEITNIDCDTVSGLHTIMVRDIKDVFVPKYKGYYFNSPVIHNQLRVMANGFKVYGISKDNIGKLNAKIPSKEEQLKIAKILELLDKKIELQIKKIEDLKLFTKKTILDVLNNEKDTQTKLFKEVCTIQTGKSNTQDKTDNGIYPFYIRSENIEHSSKYIFDCEAVITIGDGNIGKVFFYENGKFDCHQRVYVLNNFKEVTGKYLYYYFSTFFYKRAISMSAKNTVDSVRMEMISDMTIKFPCVEEQEKMTKLFDKLEAKEKLEKSKLEKLQNLKKGLMQSMFV